MVDTVIDGMADSAVDPGTESGTARGGVKGRVKRFFTPPRAAAVALVLVGVVAGGIAIGLHVAPVQAPADAGYLGSVAESEATREIGTNAIIGELTANEPVAVFDQAGGVSIGRAEVGVYGVLGTQPDWVEVVVSGPDAAGLYVTGWVPLSEAMVYTLN